MTIGGAGGVGSVAIQLAHWAGLKVFATASRPETVEWCKKLGADGTLVSTRQETLHGLTPKNIQAMHVKQESGTMMGKQVLVV